MCTYLAVISAHELVEHVTLHRDPPLSSLPSIALYAYPPHQTLHPIPWVVLGVSVYTLAAGCRVWDEGCRVQGVGSAWPSSVRMSSSSTWPSTAIPLSSITCIQVGGSGLGSRFQHSELWVED